jgi:hypothetical protein
MDRSPMSAEKKSKAIWRPLKEALAEAIQLDREKRKGRLTRWDDALAQKALDERAKKP